MNGVLSMKNIANLLTKFSFGGSTIYRGQADSSWELKPSIGRHYTKDWNNVLDFEKKSLSEFKKQSIPYLKYTPNTDIEWLCLMQHHGCATRLLDFTTNPLIALFFASDPVERHDGVVVLVKNMHSYDNVADDRFFDVSHDFAYYPSHITERIIGQSGCFVYSSIPNQGLSNESANLSMYIETIKIPMGEKFIIRSELKYLGIHYSTLFPDIDGVCKDLNQTLVGQLISEAIPF